MATYTRNYGLHQWEREDPVLHSDFNEDFAKIDAAIKEVELSTDAKIAGRVSPAQLAQALSAKPEVVLGSYIGNGESSQKIVLGYQPKLVIVDHPKWGLTTFFPGGSADTLWVVEDGFQALNSSVNSIHHNTKDVKYPYFLLK